MVSGLAMVMGYLAPAIVAAGLASRPLALRQADDHASIGGVGNSVLMASDELSAFGSNYSENKPVLAVSLGFQKCGTTMMHNVLKGHPSVLRVGPKELHYLAGEAWTNCAKMGPAQTWDDVWNDCFKGERPQNGQVAIDFTPSYGGMFSILRFLRSLRRLSTDDSVDFRFVAAIREPADRAISSISMQRKNMVAGYENATDADLDGVMTSKLLARQTGKLDRAICDGEYVDSIETFLAEIPKEALLVVNQAKLNEITLWKRIYQHLGLSVPEDEEITKTLDKVNEDYQLIQALKYNESDSVPYVAATDVAEKLSQHYQPFNKDLWKILGSPNWW
mmetsp:Transcript_47070/g.102423  ORF Transcript_47070/g.102423 Transcript_47070/m.102423 type:complete len:334 (+) Transcript_47070:98-1099(+)